MYQICIKYLKKLLHKQHSDDVNLMTGRSQPPRLLKVAEQSVLRPQGEVQGPGFVVLGVGLEVLDDVREEVRPLHAAARRLVAQLGEVDVEVVVGRLVVQVDSQLTGRKAVALQDGLLNHKGRGRRQTFCMFAIG